MKLPIDRYSILGVSIGADNQTILNQLERRLVRFEYPEFSKETLQKREEILKDCSTILLDGEKRKEYEKEYIAQSNSSKNQIEPKISISKGHEIAGLLLLLEASRHEECIGIAEDLYREQRMNMSYFSSEYKEINRIIDYATLGLAKELRYKRHYETAAEILERRISSQSVGMGEKQRIAEMVDELSNLLPFRVLDTLSRDNDERAHAKGIDLLKRLVSERGGLEVSSNIHMDTDEFHEFFKQIRTYLSVQEQISLYEEWSRESSKAAVFLNCIALTAQGFAQRKPQRIDEALKKLEHLNASELKPMVANMHLLLGNVEDATRIFDECTDQDLKEWANERAQDLLGGLCEWCREWLKRDVIRGYRDIDIDADLESYFTDMDVIDYIEGKDKYKHKHKTDRQREGEWATDLDVSSISKNSTGMTRNGKNTIKGIQLAGTENSILGFLKDNILVFSIIMVSTCSLLLFRSITSQHSTRSENKENHQAKKEQSIKRQFKGTQDQLNDSLNEWLRIKVKSLETNQVPENAFQVATPRMVEQLQRETEQNKQRGQTQIINVTVKRIELREESPRKANISAELTYKDKVLNEGGDLLTETKLHTFQRRYSFIWNGSKWIVDKL